LIKKLLPVFFIMPFCANAQSIIFGEVYNGAQALLSSVEGEMFADYYTRLMNPQSIQYYSGNYIGKIEHGYWKVLSFSGVGQYGIPIYKNSKYRVGENYNLEIEYEIAAEFLRTTSDPYFFIGIYNKGLEVKREPFYNKTLGKFNSQGVPIEFAKISFNSYATIDEAIELYPAFVTNRQMGSKVYIKSVKYSLVNKYN
jgi:hypothetical protein